MRFSKLTFLLLALVFVASCGDDDESMMVCTQSDWVGTYVGTEDCNAEGAEDATVTITASGTDSIVIAYEVDDGSSVATITFDPIAFSGCSLSETGTDGGNTITVNASLNGDQITINTSFSFGGDTSNCTITATRS